jgi:3-hydroxy-9,10-secoandrosta-1,3,5(10)-triene-9,17-dione monooxygenase
MRTSAAPAAPSAIAPDELVRRAQAMIPALRSRAFAADRARRLPDETIAELLDAGLLQMLAPRRFGGSEASLTTFLDAGIELGRGCGATAWVYGILGCHHWILSHFPMEAQVEIYGSKGHALWPLSFSGKGGTARPVDGGYLVTGQWGFCSGIDFSDWVGCAALIDKENPDDLLDRVNFVMRKDEVEVIDTWHTAGMRGTGSRDFKATSVFVPHSRAVPQVELQTGDSRGREALPEYAGLDAPYYATLLAAVLCPVLGMTRRAVEDFTDFTRERIGFRGINHATRSSTQIKIGQAWARYDAMHRVARALYEEIEEDIRLGRPSTVEAKLRQRRDVAMVADECVRIIDSVVSGAGARAQHETSPFQLIQRDIHTIRTHVVLDVEEAMELYGRHLLSIDLKTTRF